MKGKSVKLLITEVPGKGQGVVAEEDIEPGVYVTEYEHELHKSRREMKAAEKDYISNNEGCFIMEAKVNGKTIYLDATRCFSSYGRQVLTNPLINLVVHFSLGTSIMVEKGMLMFALILLSSSMESPGWLFSL